MPSIILSIPAMPLNPLIKFLLLLPNANGRDIRKVINDIEMIVPNPNRDMNNNPLNTLLIDGSNINITAALPAKLWIIPITNDFILK